MISQTEDDVRNYDRLVENSVTYPVGGVGLVIGHGEAVGDGHFAEVDDEQVGRRGAGRQQNHRRTGLDVEQHARPVTPRLLRFRPAPKRHR